MSSPLVAAPSWPLPSSAARWSTGPLALALAVHGGVLALLLMWAAGPRIEPSVAPQAVSVMVSLSNPAEPVPSPSVEPRPLPAHRPAPAAAQAAPSPARLATPESPVPRPVVNEAAKAAATPSVGDPAPASGTPARGESSAEASEPVTAPRFDAAYLQNPAPAYPPLSRKAREQGTVLLRVLVDEQGLAHEVRLQSSSGHGRLDQAALNAVARWKFQPARQGSRAVSAWVVVPLIFALKD